MAGSAGKWQPDPFGRHEYRYFDGSVWTENVSDQGSTGFDPPVGSPGQPPPPPGAVGVAAAPPQGAAVVYVAQSRNNGLAIASMVLGIVWVYWIGSLLAVIFGHIALSQIKKSEGRQRGRGMAIAGVVLGYVGLAVLALVIVVVAVNGDSTTSSSSCRKDAATLSVAEEFYKAQNDTYASESELVDTAVLERGSDFHNIRVLDDGADYELVGTAGC